MNKETVVTDEGLHRLEQELEQLKTVKRKENAAKIKVALSFGDLSENSEYDEAKNEQAITEARIAEIEAMLKNIRVVDESQLTDDVVDVGLTVCIEDLNTGETKIYKLVGSSEADPLNGMISDESPIGKALIGKRVGTAVEIEVPAGVLHYQIIKISK